MKTLGTFCGFIAATVTPFLILGKYAQDGDWRAFWLLTGLFLVLLFTSTVLAALVRAGQTAHYRATDETPQTAYLRND